MSERKIYENGKTSTGRVRRWEQRREALRRRALRRRALRRQAFVKKKEKVSIWYEGEEEKTRKNERGREEKKICKSLIINKVVL